MKRDEYKFTYENSPDFTSFPTNPVVIAHKDYIAFMSTPGLPSFNPIMVLHGSEEVEVVKPIEAGRKYRVSEKIIDIQDKGKMTVIIG